MKLTLLITVLLLCTCAPSKSISGIVIQVGESGKLLVNGDPFPGSARTFWRMRTDTCPVPVTTTNVLVVSNLKGKDSTTKKDVYGIAIFFYKKEENCWYQKEFIPGVDSSAIVKVVQQLQFLK